MTLHSPVIESDSRCTEYSSSQKRNLQFIAGYCFRNNNASPRSLQSATTPLTILASFRLAGALNSRSLQLLSRDQPHEKPGVCKLIAAGAAVYSSLERNVLASSSSSSKLSPYALCSLLSTLDNDFQFPQEAPPVSHKLFSAKFFLSFCLLKSAAIAGRAF